MEGNIPSFQLGDHSNQRETSKTTHQPQQSLYKYEPILFMPHTDPHSGIETHSSNSCGAPQASTVHKQARGDKVVVQVGHQSKTTGKKIKGGASSFRRKMWLVYICEDEEKELGRQQAPGSCPYCGGKVEAMDVEVQSRLCFLPLCFKIKRKFFCTLCARRLELYH